MMTFEDMFFALIGYGYGMFGLCMLIGVFVELLGTIFGSTRD